METLKHKTASFPRTRESSSGIILLVLSILLFHSTVYATSNNNNNNMLVNPYQATYSLKWHGINVGKSTHTLKKLSANHFTVEAVSTPNIKILPFESQEKDEFILQDEQFKPLQYQYNLLEKGKRKKGSIVFDWKHNTITHKENNIEKKETLPKSMHDKMSYIFQLQKDLQNQDLEHPNALNKNIQNNKLSYTVYEPKGVKHYLFNVVGQETIKTKIGAIKTVKIVHVSDNQERRTEFWLAKEYGYLLIKLKQYKKGKITAEALLDNIYFFGN